MPGGERQDGRFDLVKGSFSIVGGESMNLVCKFLIEPSMRTMPGVGGQNEYLKRFSFL